MIKLVFYEIQRNHRKKKLSDHFQTSRRIGLKSSKLPNSFSINYKLMKNFMKWN